jgi:hypothetical protein
MSLLTFLSACLSRVCAGKWGDEKCDVKVTPSGETTTSVCVLSLSCQIIALFVKSRRRLKQQASKRGRVYFVVCFILLQARIRSATAVGRRLSISTPNATLTVREKQHEKRKRKGKKRNGKRKEKERKEKRALLRNGHHSNATNFAA